MPQNTNEANEEDSYYLCNILYAFTVDCTDRYTNT